MRRNWTHENRSVLAPVARREIISDTLNSVAGVRKKVRALEGDADRLAEVAEGLDGRLCLPKTPKATKSLEF
jgi:hypothetical protein